MQLNDILEENSIKAISQKTKIPEDNLEYLFANKFENLNQIKTLGFLSILEREYGADLQVLRTAAKAYYNEFEEESRITLNMPMSKEKTGKSKFLFLLVFLLLGYATWYFFTQFDQKHFAGLLKFSDDNSTSIIQKEEVPAKDLSIAATDTTEIIVEDNSTEENKSALKKAIKDVKTLDEVETDDSH